MGPSCGPTSASCCCCCCAPPAPLACTSMSHICTPSGPSIRSRSTAAAAAVGVSRASLPAVAGAPVLGGTSCCSNRSPSSGGARTSHASWWVSSPSAGWKRSICRKAGESNANCCSTSIASAERCRLARLEVSCASSTMGMGPSSLWAPGPSRAWPLSVTVRDSGGTRRSWTKRRRRPCGCLAVKPSTPHATAQSLSTGCPGRR
eukprot:1193424-Prorocentrum_minimum.AAC.5